MKRIGHNTISTNVRNIVSNKDVEADFRLYVCFTKHARESSNINYLL